MNSDKKILYITSSILFALSLLFIAFPSFFTKVVISITLALAMVVICLLIKKRSIHSINKRQIAILMFIIGLVYITIYYCTGINFGFMKSILPLSWLSFIKFVLSLTIIVVATEIIRGVFHAQDDKFIDVMTFMTCLVIEIAIYSRNLNAVGTFNGFMDIVGKTFLPAISANVLYMYLSKNYGAVPNILFRLLITLYSYLIAVVPATPEFIVAFAKLLVPLIIMWFVKILYEKRKKVLMKKTEKGAYIGFAIVGVIMLLVVMLMSCQFKYGMIVIATESMTGEINKGDAIVYEAYNNQRIQENQIIVFEKDNMTIIHRVVDIEHVNGETRYYTKGDANESVDVGYITESQIVGVTHFKVPYIGYPTILIRNIFK